MIWNAPVTRGATPSRRGWSSSTLCDSSIYVFGGYGSNWLNDLHCLDTGTMARRVCVVLTGMLLCIVLFISTETLQWTMPSVRGAVPPALRGHAASLVGRNLVVVGGGATETEVYIFDTRTSACPPSFPSSGSVSSRH